MSFGSFVAVLLLLPLAIWLVVFGPRSTVAIQVIAALSVGALSLSLIVGLVARRGWARWLTAVAALVIGAIAWRRIDLGGSTLLDHLVLVAAPLVALLLAIPATGRSPADGGTPRGAVWPAWVASIGLVGLLVTAWQSSPPVSAGDAGPAALPAAAVVKRVQWQPYHAALDRAREHGRPMLVTLEASWCPYCKKMDRNTWKAPDVARRLEQVISVRLDAEDGADGSAVASRYAVRGFPTQLLLDGEGQLLSRADGYQNPRQFLAWLEQGMRRIEP